MRLNRFLLLVAVWLVLQQLPEFLAARAGKIPRSSLFSHNAAVVDLERARLTLVNPAADGCPWVVLLYDSMCGHCRAFAPKFAKLAQTLMSSKGVLVGAVNCATHEPLCMASNVSSVPVVLVGGPLDLGGDGGGPFGRHRGRGGDHPLPDVVQDASAYIVKQKNRRHDLAGDDVLLQPSSDAEGSSAAAGIRAANAKHGWYDATESSDLHGIEDSMPPSAEQILDHVLNSIDIILQKNPVLLKSTTCKLVARSLLQRKQQVIDHSKNKNKTQKHKKHTNNSSSSSGDENESSSFTIPPNGPCVRDLAGALFLALRHEAVITPPSHRNMEVLMRFLEVIQEALPNKIGAAARNVLRLLGRDSDAPHRNTWQQLLEVTFRDVVDFDIIISQASGGASGAGEPAADDVIVDVKWHSCRGSGPNYRGYTCGLWMLFHAVLANSPPGHAAGALTAIRDYVLHYFVCLECRVHFSHFATDNINMSGVSRADDDATVLWLYHAHNSVNKRLEHSGSTDPLVPKIHFPPTKLCPACLNKHKKITDHHAHDSDHDDVDVEAENRGAVLSFLRSHYSWATIEASCSWAPTKRRASSQQNSNEKQRHNYYAPVNNKDDVPASSIDFVYLVLVAGVLIFGWRVWRRSQLTKKAHAL